MDISNNTKAQVLIDALPYIQKYSGKIVVIKYGGNAMTDEALKQAVMCDIVLMTQVGIKVVLVHGGGPEINGMLEKIGKKPEFINGLRYTDKESVRIVQMVLAGKVNKDLVMMLQQYDVRALGLSGIDGNMLKAEKIQNGHDLGYVGEISGIDVSPVTDALDSGYIPVVASIAAGNDGEIYNINADTAAAKIAAELNAETFILMTDIKGVLRDKNDQTTLIPVIKTDDVDELISNGIVTEGMLPKVECCVNSIKEGVGRTIIIDGRLPHSLLIEIFSNEGVGTMFV
ncbi:MAG: acetylglutamate kinase [Oscillospiraceae bacterium]|nr:acetylglutamate kinase [Oscillospiraceae bacterium]